MPGRILWVENRCKLTFSDNYICAESEAEGKREIYIDDVDTVMFTGLGVSVSAYLLDRLASTGKTVIFCDGRKFPGNILLPLHGGGRVYARWAEQMSWERCVCDLVWRQIVCDKISAQREILSHCGKSISFTETVQPGDATNAEGRFSDGYFHALFGRHFRRHLSDSVNAALNYGYTILLSEMARIVVGHGYALPLGIHHKGGNNAFNLACDCMEPFRPLVDFAAYSNGERELDSAYKQELVRILNKEILYRGARCGVRRAMDCYFTEVAESVRQKKILTGEIRLVDGESIYGGV